MTRYLVIILVALVLAAFGIWYIIPKSSPHPMNERFFTAHYRGFGLPGSTGFLGKRWGAVTFTSPDDGGRWRFEFSQEGWNPFEGFYPDGTLREQGECYVELMGAYNQPFPDQQNLKSVKCYRPDGSWGSEVIDGTGTQTLWTPNGTKTWELVLEDFMRVRVTMWFPNGQLRSIFTYANGKRNGPFVNYDAQGNKTMEGSHESGKRTGTWKRYHPDGSLKSVETYGDNSKESTLGADR